MILIKPVKTMSPHTLEMIISHDGQEALSILMDKNLYEVFKKVVSVSYDLGKLDMKAELSKARLN